VPEILKPITTTKDIEAGHTLQVKLRKRTAYDKSEKIKKQRDNQLLLTRSKSREQLNSTEKDQDKQDIEDEICKEDVSVVYPESIPNPDRYERILEPTLKGGNRQIQISNNNGKENEDKKEGCRRRKNVKRARNIVANGKASCKEHNGGTPVVETTMENDIGESKKQRKEGVREKKKKRNERICSESLKPKRRQPVKLSEVPKAVESNDKEKVPMGKFAPGTRMCKKFSKQGLFFGEVIGCEIEEGTNCLLYCIKYEDGDCEDLYEEELVPLVKYAAMKSQRRGSKLRNSRRKEFSLNGKSNSRHTRNKNKTGKTKNENGTQPCTTGMNAAFVAEVELAKDVCIECKKQTNPKEFQRKGLEYALCDSCFRLHVRLKTMTARIKVPVTWSTLKESDDAIIASKLASDKLRKRQRMQISQEPSAKCSDRHRKQKQLKLDLFLVMSEGESRKLEESVTQMERELKVNNIPKSSSTSGKINKSRHESLYFP